MWEPAGVLVAIAALAFTMLVSLVGVTWWGAVQFMKIKERITMLEVTCKVNGIVLVHQEGRNGDDDDIGSLSIGESA